MEPLVTNKPFSPVPGLPPESSPTSPLSSALPSLSSALPTLSSLPANMSSADSLSSLTPRLPNQPGESGPFFNPSSNQVQRNAAVHGTRQCSGHWTGKCNAWCSAVGREVHTPVNRFHWKGQNSAGFLRSAPSNQLEANVSLLPLELGLFPYLADFPRIKSSGFVTVPSPVIQRQPDRKYRKPYLLPSDSNLHSFSQ
jgi:hypothetical protein